MSLWFDFGWEWRVEEKFGMVSWRRLEEFRSVGIEDGDSRGRTMAIVQMGLRHDRTRLDFSVN